MDSKYIVAYIAPGELKLGLEEEYRRLTGLDLPAKNPHISMSFGFFLKEGYSENWLKQQVGQIAVESISAWLTHFDIFRQGLKQILYVRVEPFEPFLIKHRQIERQIRAGIDFDLTVYEGGDLPEFVPHITLDYGLEEDPAITARWAGEKIQAWFEVDKLAVIKIQTEAGEKCWEKLD